MNSAQYLFDRETAITLSQVVAVVKSHRQGYRTTIIFHDNSLYQTATGIRAMRRRLTAKK